MLKKVIIENINSIGQMVELDFSRAQYGYRGNMIHKGTNLINPIAIYGANGSGKTGLLTIFKGLLNLMTAKPDDINIFVHHVDGTNDKRINSRLSLFFDYRNTSFEYTIITNYREQRIVSEKLKTSRILIERKIKKYEISNLTMSYPGGTKISGSILNDQYSIIRQLITEQYSDDNALSDIKLAFEYLSSIIFIDSTGKPFSSLTDSTPINDILVMESKKVRELSKKYEDFPLFELILAPRKIGGDDGKPQRAMYIAKEGEGFYLHERLMSDGMRAHSTIISMLYSAKKGALVVVDEIERSLHPFIARKLIRDFNENFDVQMIFASHNTSLLQELRPDQIYFAKWITSKKEANYYRLSNEYPLIREVNNIEKMYFGGVFAEIGTFE